MSSGIIFSTTSGVNDSVFGKSQEPIKMFIEKKAEAFEQKSALEHIFNMGKSKNFAEKITGMTGMQGFSPVGEGGAYPKDSMQEDYSSLLQHTTFKDSFPITQEMVEDGKLLDLSKRPTAFITGYYRTREMFGAALLGSAMMQQEKAVFKGKGFSTLANDGLTLFNTDHTSITGGCANQSNAFTNEFSDTSLDRLEAAMQDFKDSEGNILAVTPDTIIIPNIADLKRSVFSVIGADKDPDTSNNGFNYQFGRWNVIIWPYLNKYVKTGAKPWILMSSDYNKDCTGAQWLDRVKLQLRSYIDENTDDNIWKGRARWSAGFHDWRAFAIGGLESGTTLA